jgi:alpha-L-rhamnosidase
MNYLDKASAIWYAKVEADSYRCFRHRFNWNGKGRASIEIAADSTFSCAINGKTLPLQQLADYPDEPTFSSFEVTDYLRVGDNQILISVHYIGEDFLTYQAGTPFLQALIHADGELLTCTGPDWEAADNTAYASGLRCRVSKQLGFVFHYDAAAEKNLIWGNPSLVQTLGALGQRRVPQLIELPAPETILFNFGIFLRGGEKETVAATCMSDFFAPLRYQQLFSSFDSRQIEEPYASRKFRLQGGSRFTFKRLSEFPAADGYYVTGDLGSETVGCLTMSIEAPAGTVIDIAHGEHLDDGRVRSHVGGRNFADRYICREGLNHFTYRHRRLGARFLELHISNCGDGELTLLYFGLIPMEVPLPEPAAFQCEDRLLLKLNEVSINTLKLCMHEHYEDCPWREQALYAYDSRNQILYGYYVWGNYDFAASSLNLLGKSFDGERYLSLTAPGKLNLTIPVFTMAWIVELYEHWLHSGSPELFQRWQEQVDRILDRALAEKVPGFEQFYHPGSSENIWNFCEWRGELSRCDRQPQSVYNLYLFEALNAAAQMHQYSGRQTRTDELRQTAQRLGQNLEKHFWSATKSGYLLSLGERSERLYEHVQVLMLANGLVPDSKRPVLLEGLKNGSMHEITLSALYYFVNAMLQSGREGRALMLKRLRRTFEPILFSGATSLWETANGADDFDAAGSLCHAWSSVMPYFCGSVILGVRPLEPGFRRFEVNPFCADLTQAKGEIPSPHGKIRVSWQRGKDSSLRLRVEHPQNTKCVLGDAYENSIAEFEITPR